MTSSRGVARLTLMVGHTFCNTTLPIAISNGMLVHTCIFMGVLKSAKYEWLAIANL